MEYFTTTGYLQLQPQQPQHEQQQQAEHMRKSECNW